MPSQNDSKPRVASPKASSPKPKLRVSKKAPVKPVVDKASQDDPSKKAPVDPIVDKASHDDPSKKAPVEPVVDKASSNPLDDCAGEGCDIPDVPESFTRVQQRGLRKAQVAAQRKRKHGEEDVSGAEEQDDEEAQPRGRGRGRGRGAGGRGAGGRGGRGSRDEVAKRSRSRSPKLMKRPAAKGQAIPKAAAVVKEKKPKTGSSTDAADESGEVGAAMQAKLKLVLQGLPLLRANIAEKMESHPDFHSRDILPILPERRAGLKACVGCR